MKRSLPLIVLFAALLLASLAILRQTIWAPQPQNVESRIEPMTVTEPIETEAAAEAEPGDKEPAPLRRRSIVIFFPATDLPGLVGEPREIFETATPGDRVKQIVADLISGPATEQAMRALPGGTRLKQVYVLDDGTAYLDFSPDLRQGIGGGSTEELLTIYAIVDSVALNVPEIRRVGILVNGEPLETLNGHVDLRQPLRPDLSWIVGETVPNVVRDRRSGRRGARPA